MKSKPRIKNVLVTAALVLGIMFFINISLAADTAKVSVETANLRETADTNSKILEQLSLNEEVEILEKSGDWYKVEARNITGYLRQDVISIEEQAQQETQTEENTQETAVVQEEPVATVENNEQEEKQIVVEDTKLKIVPTINATDIVEVKKDQEVTIIETMNDWVCVQTQTTKGWIRKEKLQTVTEKEEQVQEQPEETAQVEQTVLKTAYVKESVVNVRKEANTQAEVVIKLSLNTAVDVYEEKDGWSKVKVSGQEGYISSDLLSDQKVETTTSRSATTTRKTEETTKKEETTTEEPTTAPSGKGATVVETAMNYVGYPYVYGASGPSSFDCSGFTSYVFKLHGVSLNRTAKGQYSNGTPVDRSNLQPGDLVMFGPSVSGINHVGIYIGGGRIVHAANASRGVTTDTINSGYYNKNYVGARRVI